METYYIVKSGRGVKLHESYENAKKAVIFLASQSRYATHAPIFNYSWELWEVTLGGTTKLLASGKKGQPKDSVTL